MTSPARPQQSSSRPATYQSPGYPLAAVVRRQAVAAAAGLALALAAQPAAAAAPDGLDSAAVAALLAAGRQPWAPAAAAADGGPAAAVGALVSGSIAALPLGPGLAHLSLGVPSLDVEAGWLRTQWLHRTLQVYGSASVFASPRHGFAAGGRLVAGAAWQATWPDTLLRLGSAVAAGAAGGVDQGLVPMVPAEFSVEVARGTRRAWWFARLSAGAEVAAAQRWTARGAFAVGVLLGR